MTFDNSMGKKDIVYWTQNFKRRMKWAWDMGQQLKVLAATAPTSGTQESPVTTVPGDRYPLLDSASTWTYVERHSRWQCQLDVEHLHVSPVSLIAGLSLKEIRTCGIIAIAQQSEPQCLLMLQSVSQHFCFSASLGNSECHSCHVSLILSWSSSHCCLINMEAHLSLF